MARAGLGRAAAGRLHPLLVRAAGLADAAPVPLRRRRPARTGRSTPRSATAIPGYMQLRRSTHAGDPHRRERRERDGRRRTSCTSRSARRTCGCASTSTSATGWRPGSSTPHERSRRERVMGADVSRVRFDPLRDFAGVVLQQGRLLLDGDFNEYVALLDRRLRAETCDLTSFGPDPDHAGVSWVPRQTPDGFRVTASRRHAHDRPRPHVRRRAARREPRPAAARVRPAALRADRHGRHALRRAAVLADARPRCRAAARTSPTSTSGSARSRTSRSRVSSRSRSASTRRRARRRPGRSGFCRTSAAPPAPPTTRTSPAGST